MATHKDIQKYIKIQYGYEVKTCWIAHTKEIYGLPVKKSPNRISNSRKYPCPSDKINSIKEAFIYFKML